MTKINVLGVNVDSNFRCAHYDSITDIVAIKMACCDEYFACIECHNDLADHAAVKWRKGEHNTKAIACGQCKMEQSIESYLASSETCPECKSNFNPKCKNHHHLYFEKL